MKRILPALPFIILLSSCEKETISADYLIGSWYIKNIRSLDPSQDVQSADFFYGTLNFKEDQSLVFKDLAGTTYEGTWVLQKDSEERDCVTDQDGNRTCDYVWNETLQLSARQGQKTMSVYLEYLKLDDEGRLIGTVYGFGKRLLEYSFEKVQ